MNDSRQEYHIGVDIGGTNTVFGLVGRDGAIAGKNSFPTATHRDFGEYADRLAAALDALAESADGPVKGIGIGAPAANSLTGELEAPVHLGWGKVNLRQEVAKRLKSNIPVFVTNDANAAALGEKAYGAAREMTDFIVLTLGTGVGSGIFVNNRLVTGANGVAGELGHLRYAACGNRRCACGRSGCLDAWCSANGLVTTTRELIARDPGISTLNPSELTAYQVYVAASEGDKIALEAFRITGETLGNAIADMVTFGDPQAVILFGGLAASGKILLQHVRKAFADNVLPMFADVKILLSTIAENDAALLGAAGCAKQSCT